MANEIRTLHNSLAGVKNDWKEDWKEDAKADWKSDFRTDTGQPANTVAASLSAANPAVGANLVANLGTWTGTATITYTYTWFRGSVKQSETSNTYVVTNADRGQVLKVEIRAVNSKGTIEVELSTSQPIASAVNSVAPVVSGTAQVGQTLTTTTGTWSGSPTYTYQWFAAGVAIPGATASTYVLAAGQVGKVVKAVVTATNAYGAITKDSNNTASVIAA